METTKDPIPTAGLQSAYTKLLAVRGEGAALRGEMRDISKQIEQLMQQQVACREKQLEVSSGSLREAADDYSREWTNRFTQKMQARLPRELRDMIYEYFWADKDYRMYAQLESMTRNLPIGPHWRTKGHMLPCTCLKDKGVSHIVNPAYVGLETAQEAVAVLYRTMYMNDVCRSEPYDIPQFLCADIFHVGYQPFAFIRSFEFDINMDTLSEVAEDKTPHLNDQDLQDELAPLLTVVEKKVFDLKINLLQRRLYLVPLEEVIELIRPVYRKFKDAGAKVEVTHDYNIENTDAPWPSELRSLNNCFDSPSDTWKQERIKAYESTDIRPRHRKYRYEVTDKEDPYDELIPGEGLDPSDTEEEDEDFTEDEDDFFHGGFHGGFYGGPFHHHHHFDPYDFDDDDEEDVDIDMLHNVYHPGDEF